MFIKVFDCDISVNYVINLEDEITDFFREKLIAAFNTNEEQWCSKKEKDVIEQY